MVMPAATDVSRLHAAADFVEVQRSGRCLQCNPNDAMRVRQARSFSAVETG